MNIIPKNKKDKIYNFRVSKEEWEMINSIKKKIDLPSMLRKHIQEIYNEINKGREIDDKIYRI
uniref:Uncharacterized protein n=1 Tax=viral metagenome TaxID=1070528 RepID=A0A6M3IPA1_9ZZZZ